MKKVEFQKYKNRGSGYHWEQVSRSILKRNLFVLARYKLCLKLLEENINKGNVLDVGCGDGVLVNFLCKLNSKVYGIDSSVDAIKYASRKLKNVRGVELKVGSAYMLPFKDRSIDSIVSTEVIEHLNKPEKMLAEICRVWSGKGNIVISTPIRLSNKPSDEMHLQEYFEEDLRKLIGKYFTTYYIIKTHPIIWSELYLRSILKLPIFRYVLNIINLLFGSNPFTSRSKWRYYNLQTVVVNPINE